MGDLPTKDPQTYANSGCQTDIYTYRRHKHAQKATIRQRHKQTHTTRRNTHTEKGKNTYTNTKTTYAVNGKLFFKIFKNHKFTGFNFHY